jgi:hypothetical protein
MEPERKINPLAPTLLCSSLERFKMPTSCWKKKPVINFALGKGDWIVKKSHEYGGKFGHSG